MIIQFEVALKSYIYIYSNLHNHKLHMCKSSCICQKSGQFVKCVALISAVLHMVQIYGVYVVQAIWGIPCQINQEFT